MELRVVFLPPFSKHPLFWRRSERQAPEGLDAYRAEAEVGEEERAPHPLEGASGEDRCLLFPLLSTELRSKVHGHRSTFEEKHVLDK